jgi:HEAT repeat protein
MPAEDELLDALIEVLEDPESELNISAARAIGRLGDPRAVPALRRTLFSGYRPLEANSARALALLGDVESKSHFQTKLEQESNPRLRLAYVSALGTLGVGESIEQLFDLLLTARSNVARGEIGLAIARIIGDEKYYLQHWRSLQSDFNTSVAQALLAFQKPAERLEMGEVAEMAEACANSFAAGDRGSAAIRLNTLIRWLPKTDLDETLIITLQRCSSGLQQFKCSRKEYVLLALHALDTAFNRLAPP